MSNIFAEFIQNSGLYDWIEITENNIDDLISFIDGKEKLDIYCPNCGQMRVFSMNPIYFVFHIDDEKRSWRSLSSELQSLQNTQKLISTPRPDKPQEKHEWMWSNWQTEHATRVMVFPFVCAMDESHHLDYVVVTSPDKMIKIGQYPSVADISFPKLDEYKKVLAKEDMKELRRAIGLHAQGIGIGSYVYLRRIFERIIDKAKDNAVQGGNLDMEKYQAARVNERIPMLKDYLPKMLVENTTFYGIVSRGIHELSEEECNSYFPVMEEFIYMILRQWEQKRKEEEAEKRISSSISNIASNIK